MDPNRQFDNYVLIKHDKGKAQSSIPQYPEITRSEYLESQEKAYDLKKNIIKNKKTIIENLKDANMIFQQNEEEVFELENSLDQKTIKKSEFETCRFQINKKHNAQAEQKKAQNRELHTWNTNAYLDIKNLEEKTKIYDQNLNLKITESKPQKPKRKKFIKKTNIHY